MTLLAGDLIRRAEALRALNLPVFTGTHVNLTYENGYSDALGDAAEAIRRLPSVPVHTPVVCGACDGAYCCDHCVYFTEAHSGLGLCRYNSKSVSASDKCDAYYCRNVALGVSSAIEPPVQPGTVEKVGLACFKNEHVHCKAVGCECSCHRPATGAAPERTVDSLRDEDGRLGAPCWNCGRHPLPASPAPTAPESSNAPTCVVHGAGCGCSPPPTAPTEYGWRISNACHYNEHWDCSLADECGCSCHLMSKSRMKRLAVQRGDGGQDEVVVREWEYHDEVLFAVDDGKEVFPATEHNSVVRDHRRLRAELDAERDRAKRCLQPICGCHCHEIDADALRVSEDARARMERVVEAAREVDRIIHENWGLSPSTLGVIELNVALKALDAARGGE